MRGSKSSISKAKSYKEISEFWDTHDLADFWDQTKKADFKVNLKSEITYYALDKKLSDQIQLIAHKHGVSPDTLINLWVQEKLQTEEA